MLDKEIVSVKNFKGLSLQGADPTEGYALTRVRQGNIPFDYALESVNLYYQKNGSIRTRDGFEKYVSSADVATPFTALGNVTGLWQITNLQGVEYTDRWLILTYEAGSNTGRFYDTQVPVTATNPVLSIVGMKYAFVINAFGRMYISPWSAWADPLGAPNGDIYLYNGLYNARRAGCAPPAIGTFGVTATATGNCTPGLHFISVLFETDSGFRSSIIIGHDTTPLPVTTTTANATMSFANIPVGAAGTGVIRRHIIVTKIVVNNNGQGLYGYEPFIAVTINDNTTTAATFTKPDSALVDSAQDYIYKNIYIRAYTSMAQYGNRMVYLGGRELTGAAFPVQKDTIAVSDPNVPEHIWDINGFPGERNTLLIGEGYVGNVMCGLEQNGIFYIFKEYSTHSIVDNPEDDPANWPVSLVNAGKGAYPLGIALIGPNPSGLISGGAFIAGSHGISYFNNQHSEYTLTENIWDNLIPNIADIKWSRLIVDPSRKLIFWTFGDPLVSDFINVCKTISYYDGLSPDKIKISEWSGITFNNGIGVTTAGISIRSPGSYGTVTPSYYFNTNYPLLTLAYRYPTDSRIYIFSEASSIADGYFTDITKASAIFWYLTTGYTPNDNGEIYQFSNLRMRTTVNYDATVLNPGNQDIAISFGILDDTSMVTLPSIINPTTTPKKFLTIPINAKAEQIRLKLSGTNRVFIQQLVLFGSKVGLDRPR